MPLKNFPLNTKYTPGDTVFSFISGKFTELEISEWEVIVDDPDNDLLGRQINIYKFAAPYNNITLREDKIFSSKNSLRKYLKGDYINRAIESGGGGSGVFAGLQTKNDNVALTFGTWTDFGGWSFAQANFVNAQNTELNDNLIDVIVDWDNTIWDGSDMNGALLPADVEDLDDFKAAVKSYDNDTTLWTNGYYIKQKKALDTVSITNGSPIITGGASSAFLSNVRVGDQILILKQSGITQNQESVKTVLTVDSNTQITCTENLSYTFSNKLMLIYPRVIRSA